MPADGPTMLQLPGASGVQAPERMIPASGMAFYVLGGGMFRSESPLPFNHRAVHGWVDWVLDAADAEQQPG